MDGAHPTATHSTRPTMKSAMFATKVSKSSSQCTPCRVTKMTPIANMRRQSSAESRSLRSVIHGTSCSAVITVSTMANCESMPRQSSITKKRMAKAVEGRCRRNRR